MTRRIVLVDIGAGLTLRGVLPSVALGAEFTARVVASGGQAPYSYAVIDGAAELAAAGINLDAATGAFDGTTIAAGRIIIWVRATDLSGAHVDRQFVVTVIAEPLSLSGAAPAWTVGVPYSYTYTAEHGVPPYSFSLVGGALPAGFTPDAGTHSIGGTSTALNAPAWTVQLEDSAGAVVQLRDNVTLGLLGDFADATAGAVYVSDIPINGGDLPYSNPRVTAGSLAGTGLALSIVGDKLRLSGTAPPTTTIDITVAADSADGQTATSVQSIVVASSTGPVVTWNADDKDPRMNIGGADLLLAVGSQSPDAWISVRATFGRDAATCNHYFESHTNNSQFIMIGVATATAPLDTYPAETADGFAMYAYSGEAYNNSVSHGFGSAYSYQPIGVLLKNGKLYFRQPDGNWYNSGDPIAETGWAFEGITGVMFPTFSCFQYGGQSDAAFSASSFVLGALPAGTQAWGS